MKKHYSEKQYRIAICILLAMLLVFIIITISKPHWYWLSLPIAILTSTMFGVVNLALIQLGEQAKSGEKKKNDK